MRRCGWDASAPQDHEGHSLLHAAAAGGRLPVVQLLMDHGASLHDTSASGLTPMHAAAAAGNAEVLYFLVRGGGDMQAKDALGCTALQWAARYDRLKVLREGGG